MADCTPESKSNMRRWVYRLLLTVVLAIPAWVMLAVIVSVVMCGMIGPWGGALDGVDRDDVPPQPLLSGVFSVLMVLGPVMIGWKWSGRVLDRRAKSAGRTRPRA